MIRDRDCDKVEAEIFELFGEIRKVASPDRISLEDAVKRAIEEGSMFKQWQQSMRPLGKVRLFQNRNGELLPAGKFRFIRFPFLRSFGKRVNLAGDNGLRQLEIWKCDSGESPVFPLSKIRLSEIPEKGRLKIEERLRDDLLFNMEISKNDQSVSMQLGLKDPRPFRLAVDEWVGKTGSTFLEAIENWKKTVKFTLAEGALPLILVVLTLVLIPSVMRSDKDTGPSRDDIYTQSHSEFDEDQILGQKCFKHLCGDPKYLSDTDTVNGA